MSENNVLRSLNLPQEYAQFNNHITDYKITRDLEIERFVDQRQRTKERVFDANGKFLRWVYTDPAPTYTFNIVEKNTDLFSLGTNLPQSGTYTMNALSTLYNSGTNVEGDSYSFERPFQPVEDGRGWIGYSKTSVGFNQDNLLVTTSIIEAGYSQNVIPKVFVKRVNGISEYKNPVTWTGEEIIGEDVYNQGAPASSMNISHENAVMQVWITSKTITLSGAVGLTKKLEYVPVSDILAIMGLTKEELEYALRTEVYHMELNPATHITSTSTEVIKNGNKYKGITYYNGIDASITKPSGKITSYGKTYPGHVQRWILKQWNQDGSIAPGTGTLGSVWEIQFASNVDSTITVLAGTKNSYNASTKTLTYDASKISKLTYEFEESPAQRKQHSGQTTIVL